MWIDRVSSLTSTGSTRKAIRHLKTGLCLICLAFSLTACAQQSDLVKVEKDFAGKIIKLDQEKKALARVVQQAKQEIATAQEQQKAELNDEIAKARAQLNSEVRSLREEILPKGIGDLETQLHQVRNNFEKALVQHGQKVSALKERQEQRDLDLSNQITALDKRLGATLEQQAQKVSAQFVEFQRSLGQFKEALSGVDKRLGEERKRATSSETNLRQDFDKRQQAFRTKLDSDTHALAKKLDADMKGLHGYLEKDVRPSLASIAKAFDQEKNRVSQEFVKFKSSLQRVEQTSTSNVTQAHTQLEAQAKHVQELRETVAGMREVLDSMAGMLGTRSDHQMNQLGQLTARLERLEKEQSAEAAKQASNTQAVSTHLNEVTASVQSIGQSFEQFQNVVSAKLNKQADRLQAQARKMVASSTVSKFRKGLKANVTQLNELTKAMMQLKDVVRAMGEKLGSKVDAHESQIIEMEQAIKKSGKPARSK